ncbi:MAG: tRNA pseudouridine(55) synthase TruB [Bacilli bacterium]|nr:tRNA pseudouridine(55) synthase TruB [Bacilli bacterium]
MNYKVFVDSSHKLPNSYIANLRLVVTKNIFGYDIYIEKRVLNKYVLLSDELLEYGINIGIVKCFDSNTSDDYCTGLALEFVIIDNDNYIYTYDKGYDVYKDKFDIIRAMLCKYGFIVRDNSNNCGFYIRYVGYSTANIIYQNGMSFEEYINKYSLSGVLVINKPSGITSRDVVNYVSRVLDTKKVGHTGTLDPLASGVLVLTVGCATKVSSLIVANDKDYLATVKVGVMTDTLDTEGNILCENRDDVPNNIDKIVLNFNKTYMQEVPKYSAVKVNGKKLYQYARSNEDVILPKKSVSISNMHLIDSDDKSFRFSCSVSKGTYIRSLIRDIGLYSGCPMVMSNLIRTRQGKFTLNDSYTLDDIDKWNFSIIPIDEALDIPVVELDGDILFKVKNGAKIQNKYNVVDKVLFKDGDSVVAIYVRDDDNLKSFVNFS